MNKLNYNHYSNKNIIINYGPCEIYKEGKTFDHNGLSLSSTQIDFRDKKSYLKGIE